MGVPSPFSIYRYLPSSIKCSSIQQLVGNKRPNIGNSSHKDFSFPADLAQDFSRAPGAGKTAEARAVFFFQDFIHSLSGLWAIYQQKWRLVEKSGNKIYIFG